jgi:DNA polymerase epsilon subunit 1
VTHTGANIIKRARETIEKIGKPLELDTDGVWCCLPASFPETYEFRTNKPNKPTYCNHTLSFFYSSFLSLSLSSLSLTKLFLNHILSHNWSFLCTLLNRQTHREFQNHQYQTLVDPITLRYEIKSECTIFFEIDGPYKAMVLPTSTEEGECHSFALSGFVQ